MDFKKDVRFSEKKIDESWKEQTVAASAKGDAPQSKSLETSQVFLNLIQSLGMQALMGLGAMPVPGTNKPEINLEIAKEAIDTLLIVRDKTIGNLSGEEKRLMDGLINELQVKFAQSV